MSAGPWYRDGLKFTCTQCGNCCTGAPGYVYVSREEIGRIAAFLGRPDGTLGREHLRRVGLRHSLTEDPRNGDCCFLKSEDGKRICSIYPVRPLQCRTWPFWDVNLSSPDDWRDASRGCPGMNRGRHYDLVQIEVRLKADRVEDLPT
jgi:Fe-S-cluster containining protein